MTDDDDLAVAVAAQAGALLLGLRAESDRREAADAIANDLITARLVAARPSDVIFSEEAADDPARLAADRVWIVDPLDGTTEYREPGRIDWAVHIALWECGSLAAGAVALPAQGRVLTTGQPPSITLEDLARPARIVVSRTRPPVFAAALAAAVPAELVPLGSAGAKVAAVLSGEADVYVHAGGQFEWDSAAPVAVALAAGLHASRLDGSSLEYNRPDPRVPDLLVCRREFAAQIIDFLR